MNLTKPSPVGCVEHLPACKLPEALWRQIRRCEHCEYRLGTLACQCILPAPCEQRLLLLPEAIDRARGIQCLQVARPDHFVITVYPSGRIDELFVMALHPDYLGFVLDFAAVLPYCLDQSFDECAYASPGVDIVIIERKVT